MIKALNVICLAIFVAVLAYIFFAVFVSAANADSAEEKEPEKPFVLVIEKPEKEMPDTDCDCAESKIVFEKLYTEADVIAMAKMLYGEARECAYEDQRNCCITACNRADDSRWAETVHEVIEQPNQYHGYNVNNPICENLKAIAETVLNEWSLKKQGISIEWNDYNSFYGDGVQNHYYVH